MGFNTELQVPDLWFDFYARLLPGAAFVAAVRFFVRNETTIPSTIEEIIVLLGAGYFVGLLVQPLGSRLTGWVERLAEVEKSKDKLFIRRVQEKLGSGSRQAMILEKMHGEVTFFVQLVLLLLVFCLIYPLKTTAVLCCFLLPSHDLCRTLPVPPRLRCGTSPPPARDDF